jgi:hypothetical protein
LLIEGLAEALQEVAFELVQESVADVLLLIVIGPLLLLILKSTVGGLGGGGGGTPPTATDAFLLIDPPAPVHRKVNTVELVKAPEDWLPFKALLPVQVLLAGLAEAVQLVVLVLDQRRVDEAPEFTLTGLAVKVNVGGAGGLQPASATHCEVVEQLAGVHVRV